ncbi:MAG TPA: ABC transporter permease [Acetobacteraceae bacterium]|nr:ABC transporter permease [Acetobacteraceae bacterium]
MVRATRAVLVLFGISVLVFLIFFATPGADPAARLAGRGASAETLAAVRHEYGLDRPLPLQYAALMRRLFVTRDLPSFVNRGQLVVPAVLRAAPVTLALATGAAVLWLLAGLAIGLVAAAWRGRAADWAVTGLGLIGVSVPVFWLGEVVNLITQSRLHDWFLWVPPLGLRAQSWGEWFRSMVLPWTTLAVLYAGVYGRVLRTSLIEAYREDYIRTARAKGIGEARVVLVHALRNALVPVVALFGLDFGALVGGGTLLVEVVFGLRGVGKLTYDALQSLDLAMVMAAVLYAAFFVVLANAAVDALQAALDPRQR